MPRSVKKGPYIDPKLLKKIEAMNRSGTKRVIRTWSRRSMVTPDLIGHTLAIHNGKKFFPFILQKTWWDINSVNFLLLGHLDHMRVVGEDKVHLIGKINSIFVHPTLKKSRL